MTISTFEKAAAIREKLNVINQMINRPASIHFEGVPLMEILTLETLTEILRAEYEKLQKEFSNL